MAFFEVLFVSYRFVDFNNLILEFRNDMYDDLKKIKKVKSHRT